MSDHTPTTQQVEDGFAHEPEYEYHNPIGYGAHVQGNRRAFRRWLAEVERAAAEKAWGLGYQNGQDSVYTATTEFPNAFENPYRREEA